MVSACTKLRLAVAKTNLVLSAVAVDEWENVDIDGGMIKKIEIKEILSLAAGSYLPSEVGMLTDLTEFKFKETNLGGSLPSELGQLNQMVRRHNDAH